MKGAQPLVDGRRLRNKPALRPTNHGARCNTGRLLAWLVTGKRWRGHDKIPQHKFCFFASLSHLVNELLISFFPFVENNTPKYLWKTKDGHWIKAPGPRAKSGFFRIAAAIYILFSLEYINFLEIYIIAKPQILPMPINSSLKLPHNTINTQQ